MGKLIDKEPKYTGEVKVWNSFGNLLPQDWVIYNNRSVNGREYDFCVIAPAMGFFIVEVKGWEAQSVLTVVDQNTIIVEGRGEPEDSPRGQARGYRFDLLKKIQRELGMNPLVMSLVCYPFITEKEYFEKGLNIVSERNETILQDDFDDASILYQKFVSRYNVDKGAKHDELTEKNVALIRHYFEPNYDLKSEEKVLNPGYSRLRILYDGLNDNTAKVIIDEYFNGIKEIVILDSQESFNMLVQMLNQRFLMRNIHPSKGNLDVGREDFSSNANESHFSIFNFEIELVQNLKEYINQNILVEEGEFDQVTAKLLDKLSQVSQFNFQQYEIEHAPCDKNILVTAGAGTGKTYSMVSRIAYLCNKTADSVVDIVSDIAMITFTNDAADNMKTRLKRMFLNYFVLTSNEKYMHLIEDMNQIQISTIHKFAISLLKRDCMRMGLGFDCEISSETYNRRKLYHQYLNDYLAAKSDENPDFPKQLPMTTYDLEDLIISFCDKFYDRSIDIKQLTSKDFGNPTSILPYFNELIDEVVVKAEKDYSQMLKNENLIGLRECMIQINDLVKNHKLIKQGLNYKYVFVDEFQDTDDTQIETIVGLQHLFGSQCHMFIVGDLKQSIYRFRGASLSAFDKAVAFDGKEKWNFYSLNRNYRTDKRLLNRFHRVFAQMGLRGMLPYDEKIDRLESQILNHCTESDLVRKIDTHMKDKDSFYKDLFDELEYQESRLQELNSNTALSNEEKTIAILVRYNWQIRDVVKEAEKRNISVKVTEGGDLYRLISSRDLYKLVMGITHPCDKTYIANLIESNYVSLPVNIFGISGESDANKTEELIKVLDQYFMLYMGKSWGKLVEDFETRPVLVVLRDIYEATKPWTHFKDKGDQASYRENYECLIEKLTNKYARDFLTINKVLEFLKINITTYQEEASRNSSSVSDDIKIICTTVHKSKGLEYGTVVIPFTNEDISTIDVGGLNVSITNGKVSYGLSIKNIGSEHNDEFDEKLEISEKMKEESRILYVAMTRTIRNLVWFNDLDSCPEYSWADFLEGSDQWQ